MYSKEAYMEIYKCEVCGNVVDLLYNGGGTLVCCGQDMVHLAKNQDETVQETHLPHVEEKEQEINVQVGKKMHPMEEKHYIEWIALVADKGVIKRKLKVSDEPKVTFKKIPEEYEILVYCNVHGLYSYKK